MIPQQIDLQRVFDSKDPILDLQVWQFSGPLGPRSSELRRDLKRQFLAEFLNVELDELHFTFGPYDKPRVFANRSNLEYSISHAPDSMVIAVARNGSIGVDIGLVLADFDVWPLIEQFCSEREQRHIFSMPSEKWQEEFQRLWVRKEAVMKSVGLGLHLDLQKLDVLDSLVNIRGLPSLNDRTRFAKVLDVSNSDGYCISVASLS